jgi:hypothetical protein
LQLGHTACEGLHTVLTFSVIIGGLLDDATIPVFVCQLSRANHNRSREGMPASILGDISGAHVVDSGHKVVGFGRIARSELFEFGRLSVGLRLNNCYQLDRY